MVGAGISALLGEAGVVAGWAVWLSFPLAGVIATLQGYAVAKLGARYPSSGGIVTFLLQGFGPGHITAVTSWLLSFASIFVTAMVAVSFGSYGSSHFLGDDAAPIWGNVLTTAVVLLVAVANIAGARLPRSVFCSTKIHTLRELYPDNPVFHEVSEHTRLAVSEPLGDLAGAWNEVPHSSFGVVHGGQDELHSLRSRYPA